MAAFEIHVKILQLLSSLHKNTWFLQTDKKIDWHF